VQPSLQTLQTLAKLFETTAGYFVDQEEADTVIKEWIVSHDDLSFLHIMQGDILLYKLYQAPRADQLMLLRQKSQMLGKQSLLLAKIERYHDDYFARISLNKTISLHDGAWEPYGLCLTLKRTLMKYPEHTE